MIIIIKDILYIIVFYLKFPCVPCVLLSVPCGEKKSPQGAQGNTQGTQGI